MYVHSHRGECQPPRERKQLNEDISCLTDSTEKRAANAQTVQWPIDGPKTSNGPAASDGSQQRCLKNTPLQSKAGTGNYLHLHVRHKHTVMILHIPQPELHYLICFGLSLQLVKSHLSISHLCVMKMWAGRRWRGAFLCSDFNPKARFRLRLWLPCSDQSRTFTPQRFITEVSHLSDFSYNLWIGPRVARTVSNNRSHIYCPSIVTCSLTCVSVRP